MHYPGLSSRQDLLPSSGEGSWQTASRCQLFQCLPQLQRDALPDSHCSAEAEVHGSGSCSPTWDTGMDDTSSWAPAIGALGCLHRSLASLSAHSCLPPASFHKWGLLETSYTLQIPTGNNALQLYNAYYRQKERRVAEDEMVGWHHQLNGREFEQTPGDSEGQGILVCCSPWGHQESDMT